MTDEPTPEMLGEKAPEHPLHLSDKERPFWINFGGPIIFDTWDRRIMKVPEGRYTPMPHADFQNVIAWTALNLGGDIFDILEATENDQDRDGPGLRQAYPLTREQALAIAEIICGIGFAMGDGVAFDYPYGRDRWIGIQSKAVRFVREIKRRVRRFVNRVNPWYEPPAPPKTYSLDELMNDLALEDPELKKSLEEMKRGEKIVLRPKDEDEKPPTA